jgi:predicted glycoside hydrolase/deacetylase ChbG (UPF0249 family)
VHESIHLITRGDDLGTFQAGNRAIVDAFQHGILRNASLMVPAPNFLHAAYSVKNLPGLCLGLHITLTSEWITPRWGPISPPEVVPSLVDKNRCFFPTSKDLFRHGVVIGEAMREVRAQLALARSLKLDIRYLDEHMGVGWIYEHTDSEHKRLTNAFRQLAYEEGLIWHEDIANMRKLDINQLGLLKSLDKLQAGSYVMITHPAYAEPETQAVVGQSYSRPGEFAHARMHDYQLLCDPEVARIVRERKIQLARYDEVLSYPATL